MSKLLREKNLYAATRCALHSWYSERRVLATRMCAVREEGLAGWMQQAVQK
ncbi:unnamed protein product [Trichogramma brassicae]|uniref:Uncharacterized protein n=1 Tax=Trichogramma brassicae TaxID=86971 RepID=A0A6H5HRM1_9HYME|nr:unnamed protein product [Trichogramma brassicae]